MAEGTKQERTLENKLLDKVGEAVSDISDAKHVDQVISAIHSVAVLLFPVDPSLFSGNSHLFIYSYFTSVPSQFKISVFGLFFSLRNLLIFPIQLQGVLGTSTEKGFVFLR